MTIAGPLAESVYRRETALPNRVEAERLESAARQLAGDDGPARLACFWKMASILVRAYWPQIERLAEALVERRSIHGRKFSGFFPRGSDAWQDPSASPEAIRATATQGRRV